MQTFEDNSVDALCTDPPAGISFMGQDFDSDRGGRDHWIAWLAAIMREALRVTKPGGHGFVWALPKTSHWTALALEEAGWEIREKCYHLFAQGFPKSKSMRDIGRPELGSALKPAAEEWILVRKPLSESSIARNVERWGTGCLNIDASRIGTDNTRRRSNAGTNGDGWGMGTHDAINGSDSGRWPSNVTFSHVSPGPDGTGGCEEIGTRRVKTTSHSQGQSTGKTIPKAQQGNVYSPFGQTVNTTHVAADGTETVTAWKCVEGGTIASYQYAYGGVDVSLLDEPSFLLDRLRALLQDLREHSTSGNSLLQSASAFYRNEHKQSAAMSDGLGHAIARVLHVSELPGFQSGYQSCHDFCDAHLHQVLAACQDGLPSLVDALAHVHSVLTQLVHSPKSQCHARLSSSDAVLWNSTVTGRFENRTSGVHHVAPTSHEQVDRTEDRPQSAQQQNGPHDSRDESNTFAPYSHETPTDNAGIAAVVRLLSLFCIDLAWRFILPAHIIQRSEIVINLPSCPVRLLDEQAGERKGHTSYRGLQPSGQHAGRAGAPPHLKEGTNTIRGYADTGGASRFFQTFPPEVPRFVFQSKPSRAERERGLAGMPTSKTLIGAERHKINPTTGREVVDIPRANHHPTVKSIALMRHLLTLVVPPGGTVLDCFAGSGSTLVAAVELGMDWIGIEQDGGYHAIAAARVLDAELRMDAAQAIPLLREVMV